MTCEWFHGTSRRRLASIAHHGLQPTDVLKRWGRKRTFEWFSKPGVVYLTMDYAEATRWSESAREFLGGDEVILCVHGLDGRRLSRDPNLPSQDDAFVHKGRIPTDHLRVHRSDGRCRRLRAYQRAGWL